MLGPVFAVIGSVKIDGAAEETFSLVEEILHDLFEPSETRPSGQ